MSAITIQQMADRVGELLVQRLNAKGATLQARLAKAGRRLPRRVRDAGTALVQATEMAQNPKLLMQVDDGAVALAYDICVKHLNTIDPVQARRGVMLNIAASVAFSLLVVAVLVVVVLYLRGFV